MGVGDRDHQQAAEVVDYGRAQQEHPQPGRRSRRQQRDRPERKRRVGGHRRAPPVGAVPADVEAQVDRDRDDHPAGCRDHRDRESPALAEFAQGDLALGLETHH